MASHSGASKSAGSNISISVYRKLENRTRWAIAGISVDLPRFGETGRYRGRDTSAGGEGGGQGDLARLDDGTKIVEDPVCDIFIKNPLVSEALQVMLQTFKLDTFRLWRVSERQGTKIRVARFRTDRGEFGANDFDRIISARKLVFERLEHITERGTHWIKPMVFCLV